MTDGADGSRETLVELRRPAGAARWQFEHNGRAFLVFVVDGEYVVLDGLCPHKQARLASGLVRDGAVVCPSHWYAFDLRTGACRTSGQYALTRYPVELTDGRAFVRVPPAPTRSWAAILHAHAQHRPPG